jgi:hypothetical protein
MTVVGDDLPTTPAIFYFGPQYKQVKPAVKGDKADIRFQIKLWSALDSISDTTYIELEASEAF